MRTPVKLGLFAVALVAAFGAAAAVGAAVGPIETGSSDHDGGAHGSEELRLVTAVDTIEPGVVTPFEFSIDDASAAAVTDFDVLHERQLHLIVVSRDLVDYHHLHPALDESGAWSVELPPLASGEYLVYADFQPAGGERQTLTTELAVAGVAAPPRVLAPNTEVSVDGYDVRLDTGHGGDLVTFAITRDGEAITPDPYLGAAAHLVVIRASDFDFLHAHPLDATSGAIPFEVTFTTPDRYRLFLEFSHGGAVHLAPFTVDIDSATTEVSHGHDD